MDLDLLKIHLEKSNNNILILGDFFSDYKLLTPEEAKFLTHKNLVKNTDKFYDIYKNKVYRPYNESPTLKAIRYLVDHYHFTVYLQTIADVGDIGAFRLKGNSSVFYCSKCKDYLSLKEIEKQNYICPKCGRVYRPNILLAKDRYDISLLESYDEILKTSDTIFLVGFDFNEEELVKQLYIETNKKVNENGQKVSIFVGETNAKELFEEYSFDFIVDEKTDTAMQRFVEKLKQI